jgi:uncharacterized membrane protein YphA (DoxX/SURF4 family)
MTSLYRNVTAGRVLSVCANVERALIAWVEKYDPLLARVAMAVVYFWFGILKLFGLSAANPMVQSLQAKTLPFLSFDQFIVLFALFEMLIGILFLIPKATRLVMVLFLGHMVTTTMPLFVLPRMTWQSMLVPTMEGQYIIKNIILIALAASVGTSLRRGYQAQSAANVRTISIRQDFKMGPELQPVAHFMLRRHDD